MIAETVRSATSGRMRCSSETVSRLSRSVAGVTGSGIFCLLRTIGAGRFTRSGHDFSRFSHHSGYMATTTFPSGDAWGLSAFGRASRSVRDGARRLAELAATPLVPADYLDVFNPLRKGAELRGRVVSVTPETEDAATLVIKPGADWAGHVPGQYVRVGIDVDGVRLWRAYSLTHGPRADGYISITVKAVPEGTVSPYLVHRTQPGTLLHLEQATGDFVLPDLSAVRPAA